MKVFNLNTFSYFQVASFILIIGIVRRVHWALLPWLVLKWIVILILLALLLADFAIGGIYSQYLSVTSGFIVFSLLNWIAASITFWQIRHENVKVSTINDLNYIHLTSLPTGAD